jgi:hypothetical protein
MNCRHWQNIGLSGRKIHFIFSDPRYSGNGSATGQRERPIRRTNRLAAGKSPAARVGRCTESPQTADLGLFRQSQIRQRSDADRFHRGDSSGHRGLGDMPVHVVLTTGYRGVPGEVGALPPNFTHADYLPGLAMAERCDLMVHHGGHGSVMTGLQAGTPAVIVPTITERENNARRLVAFGAGEIVIPVTRADGEKTIDAVEFGAAVNRVLKDEAYRHSAKRVSESMRQYAGAKGVAHQVEQFAAGISRRPLAAARQKKSDRGREVHILGSSKTEPILNLAVQSR